MFFLLLLLFIGKLYLYLGQREFISCEGELDDIKGIAFVPEHVGDLKGKCTYYI